MSGMELTPKHNTDISPQAIEKLSNFTELRPTVQKVLKIYKEYYRLMSEDEDVPDPEKNARNILNEKIELVESYLNKGNLPQGHVNELDHLSYEELEELHTELIKFAKEKNAILSVKAA